MKTDEEWYGLPEYTTGIVLKVTKKDKIPTRCGSCKRKVATEKFIGFCGHELYLCNRCVKKCCQ